MKNKHRTKSYKNFATVIKRLTSIFVLTYSFVDIAQQLLLHSAVGGSGSGGSGGSGGGFQLLDLGPLDLDVGDPAFYSFQVSAEKAQKQKLFKWSFEPDSLSLEYDEQEMARQLNLMKFWIWNTKTNSDSDSNSEQILQKIQLSSHWLRERCLSKDCVDLNSRQPLKDPHEIDSDIEIQEVVEVDQVDEVASKFNKFKFPLHLQIKFSDGVQSSYSVENIFREVLYFSNSNSEKQFQFPIQSDIQTDRFPWAYLWDSSLITPPKFDHKAANSNEQRNQLITTLLTTGIAVLDNVPREAGFCTKFGETISTLRVTEWGKEFNVRTEADTVWVWVWTQTETQSSILFGADESPGEQQNVDENESNSYSRNKQKTKQIVVTKKHDLAYTPLGIGLHTDNPYRDPMPDFQLLHQIEGCTCEEHEWNYPCAPHCHVDNFFADGFAVAKWLKEEDPEAFQLLTEIPVRFENNGGDGKSVIMANKPIIELQSQNRFQNINQHENLNVNKHVKNVQLKAIRFSAKSGQYAPVIEHLEKSQKFYAAKRKFSEMMAQNDKFKIKLHLKPGQMVIFDNKRILHGRSFVQSDKPRFVQGCYVNRDGLWYQFSRGFGIGQRKEDQNTHQHQEIQSTQNTPLELEIHAPQPLPHWTSLSEASKEDFIHVGSQYKSQVDSVPLIIERFFQLLKNQKGKKFGQPVDLYEHGLQTASRVLRAKEPTDIIVMSLFHDMTESMVSKNHGDAAAGFLEPYLSPKATWMLRQHEVFQGYYYYHHFGANRELRQRYKNTTAPDNNSYYDSLVDWCEKFDQKSFDPYYPSLPLETFLPYVEEVFSRQAYWWDLDHPKRTAVTGGGGGWVTAVTGGAGG